MTDDIVKKMEKDFPTMMTEFKRIQEEQYRLFAHKQHDYGLNNISFGEDVTTEKGRKLPTMGVIIRMRDKMERLINLLFKVDEVAVEDESVTDTFRDIANYGIIAQIVRNGKWTTN